MDERLQFVARRLAGESMAEAERHLAEASKHAAKRMVSFVKIFDRWGTGALAASTAIPFPSPTSIFFETARVK